jgi:glutaconate CoA-transferase subunit A
MVAGVVETPGGAHFTSCVPDYGRDEAFQARYAAAAADPDEWRRFRAEYLDGDEASYQQAVRRFAAGQPAAAP